MNCLQPPSDSKTINIISGLSGPGRQPLNNLNNLWFENVKNLQSGDIMVCGGDFILASGSDACYLNKNQTDPTHTLTVTAEEAAAWKVNEDYDKVCTTDKELAGCKYGAYDSNHKFVGQQHCLCPCPDQTIKYPTDNSLLDEAKKAMSRGAKIVFMDDQIFLTDVYPDNKPGHDYTFVALQNYSNQLSISKTPGCAGGGFYWYMYGQQGGGGVGAPKGDKFLHTHAKVTSFYFIGPRSAGVKPWFSTIVGSFNPSFPLSLTFEIGTSLSGLLTNPVMRACAFFVFDELTHVISFSYTKRISGGRTYYKGKPWNGTSGFSQGGCPVNDDWSAPNTSPNHCTIPPCHSNDPQGFLQPWYDIGHSLGIKSFNPASTTQPVPAVWWTAINPVWKADDPNSGGYYPVFGEETFQETLTTDIVFCGLNFQTPVIESGKYGKTDEERITFKESDATIDFGASPSQLMGRYQFGISLLSDLLGDATKYVKVGLMQRMLDFPTCDDDTCDGDIITSLANKWLLGPTTQLPYHDSSGGVQWKPGKMLDMLNKGIPLYVFQKLPTGAIKNYNGDDIACAFNCVDGKCETSPPDPTQSFGNSPGTGCWDKHGKVQSPCYTSAKDCTTACVQSPTTIQEDYVKKLECGFVEHQDYINTDTRGWDEFQHGAYWGNANGLLLPWLQGRNVLGTNSVPVNALGDDYTGESGPMSTLENGMIAPVNLSNPYPIFIRWYESGFHWKFYMSEKNLLFSTQHPITAFYTSGGKESYKDTFTAMGYDIKWGNCPSMIAYYDQLYNYVWKYKTYRLMGNDPSEPTTNGICMRAQTPGIQGPCKTGMTYYPQTLLPPLCSQAGCLIPGAQIIGGNGSCYPGGKGKKSLSPAPVGPGPTPHGGSNTLRNVLLISGISILVIGAIIGLIIFLNKSKKRKKGGK
jgi:hypothetical protein